MSVEKIFFQSSLPRSGSSMFQNLMAQNPDFYVTPTSGVLELLYAARGNYSDSPEFKAQDSATMKAGFLSFCKEGLFGFFDGITDKKYVIDKSRGWGIHYDFLNSFYPDPKIIVLVRDLRCVFASMEKNFRKSQHQGNKIVNHANLTGTSTPKRIDVWAQSQPVGMAIERLQEMILQNIDRKVLFVKYEDLCMYPDTEMIRVYEFLGLPYYKHDYNNIEQVTVEDDEVYGVFGDHKIKNKLEPQFSQAKNILGTQVCDWIYNNYKWYFEKFNYRK